MDVEKQIMVLQDRVADLECRESPSEYGITGLESDEPVKVKLSGKQKFMIVFGLIATCAIFVATTTMLGIFGAEEDRAYHKATGKPMSPYQRLIVDILTGTYIAVWFVSVLIWRYVTDQYSFTTMFWSLNLMNVTFMAFVEVMHYSIALVVAEQAGKLGAIV